MPDLGGIDSYFGTAAVSSKTGYRSRDRTGCVKRVILVIVIVKPACADRAITPCNACAEEVIDWANGVNAKKAQQEPG
jgi:hypothetical protein